MRCKFLSMFAVVLFSALFAALCFGAQNDAVPVVFFPQTSHEFSSVLDGKKVEHDFVIQNKGTATLIVERVKTG